MDVENIHWYGHDAFRIEDAGRQIYIDPWKLPDGLPKADLVLVTHGHYDHYSSDDVHKISRPDTVLVGPPDVVREAGGGAVALSPGQTIEAAGWKVTGVAAYNIGKKFHPQASKGLGFVVTLSDGTIVYHAGDTDFVPEMKSLTVDVALLPVSGTYVMTAQEAAEAANTFKPKVAIPMHYGTIVGDRRDAEAFQQAFAGTTVIKDVER